MARRALAIALSLVVAVTVSSAAAVPLSSKRAQAQAVKAQVDALDNRLEIASEDYNEAHDRFTTLNGQVRQLTKRLRKLDGQVRTLQTALNGRADHMYRSGPLQVLDVLLGAATFEDFAATWDMLTVMNERESAAVAILKDSRLQAAAARASLLTVRAEAAKADTTMRDRKRFILAQLAERKSKLAGIESEIAALEAERAAAASRDLGGWDWGDAKRAPRGEVVDIAMRYIGRPYEWAASGPGSFDCSGFTMFVYAQVGVRLPHSSRAQIEVGERVGRAYLQPGDLVFFYRPIHHVGIYVGGGRFIHAPGTGKYVRIDSIDDHGHYSGACRP